MGDPETRCYFPEQGPRDPRVCDRVTWAWMMMGDVPLRNAAVYLPTHTTASAPPPNQEICDLLLSRGRGEPDHGPDDGR